MALTGYRLHDQRLGKYKAGGPSGETGIRSMKFALKGDPKELAQLVELIAHDQRAIFGNTTISHFLDSQTIVSALDVWLEALKQGIVFSPTFSTTSDIAAAINDQESEALKVYQSLDEKYKPYFQPETWAEFFLTPKRERGEENLKKKFIRVLRSEDLFLKSEIQELFAEFLRVVQRSDNKTYLSWVKSAFGILEPGDISSKLETTSFFASQLKIINTDDKDRAWQEIISSRQSLVDSQKAKSIDSLLGLAENANALSHFFGTVVESLREGDSKIILEASIAYGGFRSVDDRDLLSRIESLRRKCEKLPQTKLTNHFADYRQVIQGQMSSLLSNTQSKTAIALEQISGVMSELEKIKKELDDLGEDQRPIELCGIVEATLGAAQAGENGLSLLLDLMPDLRTLLNEYHQQKYTDGDIDEDKIPTFKKAFPKIAKNIQRLPRFFGSAKASVYNKLLNAPTLLIDYATQSDALQVVLDKRIVSGQVVDPSTAQKIVGIFKKLNTESARQIYFKSIDLSILVKPFVENPDAHDYYYRSPRARDRRGNLLELPEIKISNLLSGFGDLKQHISDRRDPDFWIDLVEMSKLKTTTLIAATDFDGNDLRRSIDELGSVFADIANSTKDDLSPAAVNTLINKKLFSELRGLITTVSRELVVERFTVQRLNGEQSSLLLPKDQRKSDYAITINTRNLSECDSSRYNVIDKKGNIKPAKNRPIFKLNATPYQTQFLRESISSSKKRLCRYQLAGPTLVAERLHAIDWRQGGVTLSLKGEKVFVSFPFGVFNKSENIRPKEPNRYIGVDIGERGVAWTVIDAISPYKIIDQGFIYDPQFLALKSAVNTLKASQTRGTLTISSTKIARIRESLAGSIRNKLHRLALIYDAQIIFERDISLFEMGGQRIKKMYATLKRSDLYSDAKADESINEHIWGKFSKGYKLGREVGARFTSQLCGRCKLCAAHELRQSKELVEKGVVVQPVSPQNGVYKVKINNRDIFVYSDGEISNRVIKNVSELERLVNNYSRPPLVIKRNQRSQMSRVIQHHEELKSLPLDAMVTQRGNSMLFVCPFGCDGAVDCDVQASQNIALKKIVFQDLKRIKDGKITDEDWLRTIQAGKYPIYQRDIKDDLYSYIPEKGKIGKNYFGKQKKRV